MTLLRRAAWLILLATACGGGGSGSRPAESASGEGEAAGETVSGEAEEDSADDGESEPAPARTSCDDGTCSPCGSSFCLAGWYCDESAKGGPACNWLRECASKVSCSCLKGVFSSCGCEEKAGGVYLTCG